MTKESLAKSTAWIAAFTLISKVMGFLREVLMARSFGLGAETDAYNTALTATVVIMGVLGTGLNTTLVPVFSEIDQRQGRRGRFRFLNNILTTTVVLCTIIAILFYVISPLIISIVAIGFEGEQFDLAVKLNRVALPVIVFLGITHVLMGYLQSMQVFGPYAIMGIPYNLVFIAYMLAVGTNANIVTYMVITVIAGAVQFLIQIPAVRHSGYRLRPRMNLRDPYMLKVGWLIVPVLISSSVQQLNILIDKSMASTLVTGSISALNYAMKLNEMVISVFVMAISTVVFPMLANAFMNQDDEGTRSIFTKAINLVMFITIPATVGLIVLSSPIVSVAFERGAFTREDTILTSGALVFYAVGLMANSLNLVLNRVYYSYRDTKTPMIIGLICVVINLASNIIFIRMMQHKGLALATSLANMAGMFMLFYRLRDKISGICVSELFKGFMKFAVSATVMGIIVYFFYYKLGYILPGRLLYQRLLLIVSIGVGALVYAVMCLILQVPELKQLYEMIFKRNRTRRS